VPVLVAHEPSEADSVFEETHFVPDSEEEVIEVVPTVTESAPIEEITMTPTDSEGYNFDPNAPAILEPYMMFNTGTGETSAIDPTKYLELEPESAPETPEEAALKIEVTRLQKALEEAKTTPSVKLEEVLEPEKKLNRKALVKTLSDAGVTYKKGTRTTTLKKLVDNLDP